MKLSLWITTFCLSAALPALAAPKAKPKSADIKVAGVGLVRIQHDVVGEPISQPERVEIFVTCKGKKPYRAKVFRMCIFEGHEYDAGTKSVELKMYYGRVEPKSGDVICDQFDVKSIDLGEACKGAE